MELKWNDPQPWEISGEAWRQLGQWQKAAQCWEEALRMNPANPRAQLALVELYDRLKDGPALARMAARCLALKGAKPLDEWLAELAEIPGHIGLRGESRRCSAGSSGGKSAGSWRGRGDRWERITGAHHEESERYFGNSHTAAVGALYADFAGGINFDVRRSGHG